MTTPLPKVVLVLGRPGSGKGTQCKNIMKEFGYVHFSAGDVLRQERNNLSSPFKTTLDRYLDAGEFIPAEITCQLLEQAMATTMASDSTRNKFIIDGFPGNVDNLACWEQRMAGKYILLFVMHLECDEKVCIPRCLSRGQVPCDRTDDHLERVTKRMQMYKDSTQYVINEYIKQGLVKTIDASLPQQQVFDAAKLIFQEIEDN